MALTDENGSNMVMPVSPMGNGGFGGMNDGNGWWILLLFFLLAGNGGWGGFGMGGGLDMYPWMNQSNQFNNGFRDQMLNSSINGVQQGVNSLATQLCNTGSDIQMALANGFAGIEQGANTRQMANMQTAFAQQTAMTQGFNQLGSQFAECCCENRLANCQTQNIIQNEGNATRFADANNTRDLLTAFNAGVQSLKDQLCDYRNEQKDDIIAQLRSELMFARGQASQDVQTANIQAGQRALANEVEQYVVPRPIPAYTVQNPNCCAPNYGCGCGA